MGMGFSLESAALPMVSTAEALHPLTRSQTLSVSEQSVVMAA